MGKSYLYFYKGKFRTETGLKYALIKDGTVWVSRGNFYCYLPYSDEEIHYTRDYLRDILHENGIITDEEHKHFQKWMNEKVKEGTLSVRKNCTWYHCEANDGMGEEWDTCLESILWEGVTPIETEEQVVEDYCEAITEEQFRIFLKLPECRQEAIARRWRIEKYEKEGK